MAYEVPIILTKTPLLVYSRIVYTLSPSEGVCTSVYGYVNEYNQSLPELVCEYGTLTMTQCQLALVSDLKSYCCSPLQISDKDLIKLVRQKVKLAMPYAGAFVKKDDRSRGIDNK